MSTPSKPGAMSAMALELARTDTLRIDRVLAPVRECLELMAHPKFKTDEDGNIIHYLTRSDIEGARQLYERLKQ